MNKIRLSKSTIGQEEKEAVISVLEKEYLGMGEEVRIFEENIKDYLQTSKEVICVNTGTSALHLALEALNLEFGDEILVPSLTYVASFQAISAANLKPISIDVCEETLFIDMLDAKNRLTSKTKAILAVHYASSSKGMNEVYEFAKKNNLRVIEDAAQAFGCKRDGKKIGVEGDIICFSFDGIKNITSGEGGAIFSADPEVIQKVSDARLLGVCKDSEKRYKGERSWVFDVTDQGYRYHMSNIFAAIGIVQLKRFDTEFAPRRRHIAKIYTALLSDNPNIQLIPMDYDDTIPHIFPILVLNGKREKLMQIFTEKDIQFGIQYRPNHLLSYFKMLMMRVQKMYVCLKLEIL